MNAHYRVTDSVAHELDSMISSLGSDSGVSETTSVKVLKDAIVVVSVMRVESNKEDTLKDMVAVILTPMLETPVSNNVRISKVEIPEYLGSLNT